MFKLKNLFWLYRFSKSSVFRLGIGNNKQVSKSNTELKTTFV